MGHAHPATKRDRQATSGVMNRNNSCSVETCTRPNYAKGFCLAHYLRFRLHGTPRSDIPIRANRMSGNLKQGRRVTMDGTEAVEIPLSRGWAAIIDPEDESRVSKYNWVIRQTRLTSYAVTTINRKQIYLHRFILNTPTHLDTDHINKNGLDNRRKNLRIATTAQNLFSKRRLKPGASSFLGVTCTPKKRKKIWRARIKIGDREVFLGRFVTEEEAKNAYIEASMARDAQFNCSH